MKKFEKAKVTFIKFDSQDVIATSLIIEESQPTETTGGYGQIVNPNNLYLELFGTYSDPQQ